MNTTTPVEIDTEIARLQAEEERALAEHQRVHEQIQRRRSHAVPARPPSIKELESRLNELTTTLNEIAAALGPLREEYERRGGWARYYLVDNANGHLHTTTACRNTYITTRFHWVTELSGASADEAVAQAGELSCLDCFPGHREVIESGRPCTIETPARRQAREEREAKAAAEAEKLAKTGITNPDGTPLVIRDYGSTRTLKTEVAANRAALEAAYDLLLYGTSHPTAPEWQANLVTILPALAHKRGTTVEHEQAVIEDKTRKKYDRESR